MSQVHSVYDRTVVTSLSERANKKCRSGRERRNSGRTGLPISQNHHAMGLHERKRHDVAPPPGPPRPLTTVPSTRFAILTSCRQSRKKSCVTRSSTSGRSTRSSACTPRVSARSKTCSTVRSMTHGQHCGTYASASVFRRPPNLATRMNPTVDCAFAGCDQRTANDIRSWRTTQLSSMRRKPRTSTAFLRRYPFFKHCDLGRGASPHKAR